MESANNEDEALLFFPVPEVEEVENLRADHETQSYIDAFYNSEEMRQLIRDREAPHLSQSASLKDLRYRQKNIYPDWLIKSNEWKNTKGKSDGISVSDILRIPFGLRTVEQNSQLVYWLMTVWQTANVMGLKKVTQMLLEFKYVTYQPGENIITEGDQGLTFYIIISGTTAVLKNGIGKVAELGKGKSFGEIALTKGDVRTASIQALTHVEVLSLHKLNYDHFVKDIQSAERRENFYLLRDCKLLPPHVWVHVFMMIRYYKLLPRYS